MVDLAGPFKYLYRLVFQIEKQNVRRNMYATVAILLLCYEYYYARGFFLIRLVFTLTDQMFYKSHYGKVTHQLEFNVDFNQVAFPQVGALPWLDLGKIRSIGTGLVRIYVTKGDRRVSGLALIVRRGVKQAMYTVRHVIRDTSQVQIGDQKLIGLDWKQFGTGDAVVSTYVSVDLPCADVDTISEAEIQLVRALVFLVPDEDNEVMINFVPSFKINKENEIVTACVNLRKGDSGGPTLAVLEDGTLRYIGCVSKGNFNDGGGNFISMVKAIGLDDSSDDDDPPLADVKKFNRQRNVQFRNADMAKNYGKKLIDFNKLFINCKPDLEILQHLTIKPEYEIMSKCCDPGGLADSDFDVEMSVLKRADDDGGGSDDEGDKGNERKKEKKKDEKAKRKDKAARKRGYIAAKMMVLMMDKLYAKDEAEANFEAMVNGKFDVTVDYNQFFAGQYGAMNIDFNPSENPMRDKTWG